MNVCSAASRRRCTGLDHRRRFRAAADAIGHPALRFRDLRHTAASLFAASRMPAEKVARVLGHADIDTTYPIYLHFFPDDFRDDIDRLQAHLYPSDYSDVQDDFERMTLRR